MKKIAKKLIGVTLAGGIVLGGLVQPAEAASITKYGVSINPVKNTFHAKDVVTGVAIESHANYDLTLNVKYQEKIKGKWRTVEIGWGGDELSKQARNEYFWTIEDFGGKGTYRVKLEVSKGKKKLGSFYSSTFYVK